MNEPPDDRSPIARAAGIAYEVIGVCLQMVIPAMLGHWADQYCGTGVLFAILGAILGVAVGMWGLIRLTEPLRRMQPPRSDSDVRPRKPQ